MNTDLLGGSSKPSALQVESNAAKHCLMSTDLYGRLVRVCEVNNLYVTKSTCREC